MYIEIILDLVPAQGVPGTYVACGFLSRGFLFLSHGGSSSCINPLGGFASWALQLHQPLGGFC